MHIEYVGTSSAAKAGIAFLIGAAQFIILMFVAEAYYPGYSISGNTISDLGANSFPSYAIFNSSIVLLGILALVGSYYMYRQFRWKPIAGLLVLAGIGAVGVGLFPETTGIAHGISQLLAFLFGGLAAVVAYRTLKPPMSFFSVLLGAITLTALLLYRAGVDFGLGVGGMERMIAYPVLLWGVAYGAYLMGFPEKAVT